MYWYYQACEIHAFARLFEHTKIHLIPLVFYITLKGNRLGIRLYFLQFSLNVIVPIYSIEVMQKYNLSRILKLSTSDFVKCKMEQIKNIFHLALHSLK